MELRDYVRIIQKSLKLVLGITILFVVIVMAVTFTSKPRYDATTTLTIDRPALIDQKAVNYYLYDNYYSLQSSGLLADTIINWLGSPAIVQSIYSRAGITPPEVRNVAQLGKIFTVKKLPPATVTIVMRTVDKDEGKALLDGATAELQVRANELSQKNTSDQLIIHATSPVTAIAKPFWQLDIALSLVIGFLLSIFIVFFREYLGSDKSRR